MSNIQILTISCTTVCLWFIYYGWNKKPNTTQQTYYLWCDQANNSIQIPLYFVVLDITEIAISLEPNVQSWWGFRHDIALKWWHTMKMKNIFIYFWVQTHFAWSHHIRPKKNCWPNVQTITPVLTLRWLKEG